MFDSNYQFDVFMLNYFFKAQFFYFQRFIYQKRKHGRGVFAKRERRGPAVTHFVLLPFFARLFPRRIASFFRLPFASTCISPCPLSPLPPFSPSQPPTRFLKLQRAVLLRIPTPHSVHSPNVHPRINPEEVSLSPWRN